MRLQTALLALVLPAVLAACSAAGGNGEASCALLVEHDGHTYVPAGEVLNHVETTGREMEGVLPGCDDSGGQLPPEPDEAVRLAELEAVPVDTALLWQGEVFVRQGRELPPGTSWWFERTTCSSDDPFDLLAEWLGVQTSRKVRFDGDLRPPYRLEVRVTEGPERYVGSTVRLHADRRTDAALGPREVKESLWRGGSVAARVECLDGAFRAVSLRVP